MRSGPNTLFWALAGVALLGALLFLVFRFQLGQTASERVAVLARKAELTGQIRLALASAGEAEKSSVLAITDEESKQFADQARKATATAEEQRQALGALLQASGTAKEQELLAQFSTAFLEFQRVDVELLDLAVKNTNIKASALAFGPAAEAIQDMDGALSRLLAQGALSTSNKVVVPAARAQAAALRIQVLLAPHIAEERDAKMDELEARMAKEDQDARKDLKALTALVPAGSADLQQATASYERFTTLKAQILKLSRANTNVRSLSISLNQKRKVTALCEDALAGLANAIEQERIASAGSAPVSPR